MSRIRMTAFREDLRSGDRVAHLYRGHLHVLVLLTRCDVQAAFNEEELRRMVWGRFLTALWALALHDQLEGGPKP